MKIGILVAGILPIELSDVHGNYASLYQNMLAGNGFIFEVFTVVSDQFPDSVHQCDGWLIGGSSHGAYDNLAWIAKLETFIRNTYTAKIPIVGICFGHQIMAQALGGKVDKFDGGWSRGQVGYNFEMQAEPVELYAWHQDQVTALPPDASVFAHTDFCANAGLTYHGPAMSYQPHPEFSNALMEDLVRIRVEDGVNGEIGKEIMESLGAPTHSAEIAAEIAEFYRRNI